MDLAGTGHLRAIGAIFEGGSSWPLREIPTRFTAILIAELNAQSALVRSIVTKLHELVHGQS